MKRNMSIVTKQLLSREQLFSSHMSRLREVFSQLEEELHGTDTVAASQQSMQAGVLRMKPVSFGSFYFFYNLTCSKYFSSSPLIFHLQLPPHQPPL